MRVVRARFSSPRVVIYIVRSELRGKIAITAKLVMVQHGAARDAGGESVG
jgi:hypothetical protein